MGRLLLAIVILILAAASSRAQGAPNRYPIPLLDTLQLGPEVSRHGGDSWNVFTLLAGKFIGRENIGTLGQFQLRFQVILR